MRSYLTTLGSLAAAGVMLAAISSCGSDTPTARGASAGATDPDLAAAKATLASVPLGRVVSRDVRGAGRFVLASPPSHAARLNLGHETVARLHFERHAAALGLSEAAIRGAVLQGVHSMPAGASVVQFEQRIGDVEVFRARASVIMDAANQLVSIGNSFPASNVKVWNKTTSFKLSAEEALAAAYNIHAGVPLGAGAVRDEGQIHGSSARNYAVNSPAGALQVMTATAKRVFFPAGDRLESAYYIEILGRAAGSRDNDARGYVIAAADGRILQQESLTASDTFNYRVWAEPTGNHIPTDGPIADVTPHPTGLPDLKPQTFIAPIMVTMEGFNKKTPNGASDPWLDANATFTWGNNVRAYSDRNQGVTEAGAAINDGYQDAGPDGGGGDYRADLTSPKTFDRIYDPTKSPDETPDQIKAAITQIFYVNNWLHDFWYDSGFDELGHNAQLSNLGRGGIEGDPLRAEAQDSADTGQSNNANMSSLSDGSSPRMQMYVWTGLGNRTLEVTGATFSDPLGASGFGPQTFDITGQAVLSDDGNTMPVTAGQVGSVNDACQKPNNVVGKIAVVDRGGCNFTLKVDMAQQGGATGIILVNNVTGNTAPSPGGIFQPAMIPLIGISKEDGDKMKTLLAGMPMAHLKRGVETMRDGTLDNTIVAHEWGHFWHHRLVQCGLQSCGGMSEGWGDFLGLMMAIRDGDTFDNGKTYALAQYAAQGIARDGSYFGIRRAPYSRDMAKNPFTFTHIRQMSTLPTGAPLAGAGADMSEVHNVGEIWTETLFEAYANLIDTLKAATPPVPFEDIRRRMADYLVAGLKATPTEPTFVEQRDAILSTIYATKRMDDFTAIAKGFAKRGLGVAAVAPPSSSMNLNEAVENMDFKGALGFVEAKLDDTVKSCDSDGVLDTNETGKLTVTVKNSGWVKLTKTQIKATSTDPNVTFAMPGSDMGTMEPFATTTVTLNVTAKAGIAKKSVIPITITMTDSEAAKDSVEAKYEAAFNFDESKAASKTDDVESASAPVWTMENMPDLAAKAWSREGDAMNHVWHGEALSSAGEESLISPALVVSPSEAFTIAFKHHYRFEVGSIPGTTMMGNFDGGVLEVAEVAGEGGTTVWKDISDYVDPMYPSTIFTGVPYNIPDTNPLFGRKAWGGSSAGYPANVDVKLDLGTKLAGKTVKVRFRIGTDEGTGNAGWDIDDIAFTGITNSPFTKVVDNAGTCGDAGAPTDGGARDGSAGAGGSGGSGGTGGSTPPADDSCNCSVPGGRSTGGAGLTVGAFGALAMLLRRRRRQQG